jgi:hypothetical protein
MDIDICGLGDQFYVLCEIGGGVWEFFSEGGIEVSEQSWDSKLSSICINTLRLLDISHYQWPLTIFLFHKI